MIFTSILCNMGQFRGLSGFREFICSETVSL